MPHNRKHNPLKKQVITQSKKDRKVSNQGLTAIFPHKSRNVRKGSSKLLQTLPITTFPLRTLRRHGMLCGKKNGLSLNVDLNDPW